MLVRAITRRVFPSGQQPARLAAILFGDTYIRRGVRYFEQVTRLGDLPRACYCVP